MGCKEWQDDIPKCKSPLNVIFFIINIIWCGVGSILASFINEGGFAQCTLICGIIQWFTNWWLFLIGWIWSIWWGWLIFNKGK